MSHLLIFLLGPGQFLPPTPFPSPPTRGWLLWGGGVGGGAGIARIWASEFCCLHPQLVTSYKALLYPVSSPSVF